MMHTPKKMCQVVDGLGPKIGRSRVQQRGVQFAAPLMDSSALLGTCSQML
jgi:hypothetical protein